MSATVCNYVEDHKHVTATVRLPLADKEQMLEWLDIYQQETKTTLRKSRTYPNVGRKLIFKVVAHTLLSRNLRSAQVGGVA